MKSLLSLTALSAALILIACDGSPYETVCTREEVIEGIAVETTAMPQINGDYVTAISYEMIVDASNMRSDVAEASAQAWNGTVKGDEIIIPSTAELEDFSVEDFFDSMKEQAFTCN